MYYPAAGSDAHDIELLSRDACSFIHVDFRETEAQIRSQLQGTPGFAGYDLIGLRQVSAAELTPRGWQPSEGLPQMQRPLPEYASPANSFALWAVYERRSTHSADHGADRFSLLHLHAEGVAAYDALYLGNQQQAKYLCIIQPGEGFGDNPYRFTDPEGALHKLVSRNPLGLPDFLVLGGGGLPEFYDQQPCWTEYEQLVTTRRFPSSVGSATLAVWAR
ncbi:hypothetical protein [Hymenobacter jejuensis]|uniref:Uncharacterized protein n=1 Tax=Hymenobacter jejuensis TaxID=2502781 RepID=A0A5B7ZVI1_9BACT|nr:hypothetical protein [Hymenobacter jejuensis]QDA59018.1 hypothetical protein FHG12_02380 [Hymenobacter jejuensis]